MRLDSTQRGWAVASLAILAVCAFAYFIFAGNSLQGPRGGSVTGLLFGVLGFSFMIFAALLGARKRVPVWRLGRAQTWMRGHLWLGLLSLPILLFHGGFRFGGTLTQVLMYLLIVTVASGLFGAALQNYIPRAMTTGVPLETIYDEIGNVRHLLREEADHAMETLCGSLNFRSAAEQISQRAGGFTAFPPNTVRDRGIAVAAAPEIVLLTAEQSAPLVQFYRNEMRPFLERPNERRLLLSDAGKAQTSFAGLRALMPAPAHSTIDDLRDICEEARQLQSQQRLHRWLHFWLLFHIPVSLALILLGAVHAVMALKY